MIENNRAGNNFYIRYYIITDNIYLDNYRIYFILLLIIIFTIVSSEDIK